MDDYTARQREAFASVLADALPADYNDRMAVARSIGYSSVGSLTGWAKGDVVPKPPVITRLEQALDLEPGHLSRHLGWVPIDADVPECTVEAAIASDPLLTSEGARQTLRMLYRELSRPGDGRSA